MFFKRVYRMADTWIPVDSEPLITVVCADFLQVFWIASYMQKKNYMYLKRWKPIGINTMCINGHYIKTYMLIFCRGPGGATVDLIRRK
jgi:hypothetical protein